MVQERREPTLSSIKPERDEILRHQSRGTKTAGATPRPASQQRPTKKFPGSVLAILLALAAGGAAGFSFYQLQLTQQTLQQAQGRIADLEDRLSSSSGKSAESLEEVNERLKTADSEIRKLWGVSYDTNRKAIAANKENIAKLGELASEAADASASAKKISDSQQAALSAVQTLSSEQQLVLTKVKEDLGMQQADVQRLLTLATQIDNRLKKMETQVASNSEAIKAIDAFRRSVNSDILKLQQQLGQAPQ